NECVRELQTRLAPLSINERRNIFLGTVHSFCLQNVVLPYGHLASVDLPEVVTVATIEEQDDAFAQAVRDAVSADQDPKDLKFDAFKLRRMVLDRTSDEWNGPD